MPIPADSTAISPGDDAWRQSHTGRLLLLAHQRFEARVLALMAHDEGVPLALSNLAARGKLDAAHHDDQRRHCFSRQTPSAERPINTAQDPYAHATGMYLQRA